MHNGHNPQWPFLGCISDQIVAHHGKSQRPRRQVWALVSLIGKRNQAFDSGKNLRNHPVGGVEIIRANEFPNLVQIKLSFRMKLISGHEPVGERRAAALFSRK